MQNLVWHCLSPALTALGGPARPTITAQGGMGVGGGGGCNIAAQDGHKIKMASTANMSVPIKIHNFEKEAGVTLGITAYIVYSKSTGDYRDLEQAVILTSDDP